MTGNGDEREERQEREWAALHSKIVTVLDKFGRGNRAGPDDCDYWLVDDNWGWWRHQLEVQNLNLLRPEVIRLLQQLLVDFPDWEITVRADDRDYDAKWPGMGIAIVPGRIIDDLQRDYLPESIRSFRYD